MKSNASKLVVAALALTFIAPVQAMAGGKDLPPPIVELMPHVQKLAPDLNLSAEQQERLDRWLAEAPAKRRELEQEYLAIQQKLREAILEREERIVREELIAKLADKSKQLIQMRSLCVRMLEDTLSDEQYEQVVASYRADL